MVAVVTAEGTRMALASGDSAVWRLRLTEPLGPTLFYVETQLLEMCRGCLGEVGLRCHPRKLLHRCPRSGLVLPLALRTHRLVLRLTMRLLCLGHAITRDSEGLTTLPESCNCQ